MSYLKEFQSLIAQNNYSAFLKLWEEYCAGDQIDGEELKAILQSVKNSQFAEHFGRHVETAIPLWELLKNSPEGDAIIGLIIDIQTTNNENLRNITLDFLKEKYPSDPMYQEKLKLIGLRGKENFEGAISNYELLSHLKKGHFVFHTGGWGVGEIFDVSFLREQIGLEFDFVAGRKDMSFSSAFKTLIPLPPEHFLSLRFGNPDLLEKMAKDDPVEVIRILLRDLGPKTAGEIKDELADLVIPANEWVRWWQMARSRIKKDTMIETPEDLSQPFQLRHAEVSHEERLQKAIEAKPDVNVIIQMVYNFMRDFPATLKNKEFKVSLQSKLTEILSFQEVTDAQELQIHFLLSDLNEEKEYAAITDLIKRYKSIADIIDKIELQAFRKRALIEVRKLRDDWQHIFLDLFLTVEQHPLRDYILNELLAAHNEELKKKIEELLVHPAQYPEIFLWYFQKLIQSQDLPFSDKKSKQRFFESFFILLSHLEQATVGRELIKKMHTILTNGRYAIVRQMMQDASIETCQEFLLLATKCHSLSDHDIKILHSLAEVVHPSLSKTQKKGVIEEHVIWTTKEGYEKVQKRVQQLGTVEIVEVAKEIEAARALGDLRENAEYKSALEKRNSLQAELKFLSDQLKSARILTKEDIDISEVGVGTIVDCKNRQGEIVNFTILGPWDADSDKNIISFQSKLAQSMKGLKSGGKFRVGDEEYIISHIKSYL